MDGGPSETLGRAGNFDSLPGCEESPQAMWGAVVDCAPSPRRRWVPRRSLCWVLVLWPTSRGSSLITALPPDEGVVLADVDSVSDGRSYSQDRGSGHVRVPSDDTRMAPMSDSVLPTDTSFSATALRIDDACALHPFSCISWMRAPFSCISWMRAPFV